MLMGDHGARVYGAAEIPLASYQVPILFVAPGVVPAGARLDTIASSLDVPPTILGLLGMGYDSKFFGHDLFRIDPSAGPGADDAQQRHRPDAGRAAWRCSASTSRPDLYDVDPATGEMAAIKTPDAAGRELIEDAIAYFNGADRLYRGGAYAFQPSRSQGGAAGGAGRFPRWPRPGQTPGRRNALAAQPGLENPTGGRAGWAQAADA